MRKMRDYSCNTCHHNFEALVEDTETVYCPKCDFGPAKRIPSGGHIFTVIQATTLTSKKYKAGYQHSHTNRPKEKISVQVPATMKSS